MPGAPTWKVPLLSRSSHTRSPIEWRDAYPTSRPCSWAPGAPTVTAISPVSSAASASMVSLAATVSGTVSGHATPSTVTDVGNRTTAAAPSTSSATPAATDGVPSGRSSLVNRATPSASVTTVIPASGPAAASNTRVTGTPASGGSPGSCSPSPSRSAHTRWASSVGAVPAGVAPSSGAQSVAGAGVEREVEGAGAVPAVDAPAAGAPASAPAHGGRPRCTAMVSSRPLPPRVSTKRSRPPLSGPSGAGTTPGGSVVASIRQSPAGSSSNTWMPAPVSRAVIGAAANARPALPPALATSDGVPSAGSVVQVATRVTPSTPSVGPSSGDAPLVSRAPS